MVLERAHLSAYPEELDRELAPAPKEALADARRACASGEPGLRGARRARSPARAGSLAARTRAILQLARDHGAIVRAPAAVLAQVCRSPRLDAAVKHAVDAFVVAAALDFPTSIIATGDVSDIERLCAAFRQVRTVRI
jgi:hypothetical protein